MSEHADSWFSWEQIGLSMTRRVCRYCFQALRHDLSIPRRSEFMSMRVKGTKWKTNSNTKSGANEITKKRVIGQDHFEAKKRKYWFCTFIRLSISLRVMLRNDGQNNNNSFAHMLHFDLYEVNYSVNQAGSQICWHFKRRQFLKRQVAREQRRNGWPSQDYLWMLHFDWMTSRVRRLIG